MSRPLDQLVMRASLFSVILLQLELTLPAVFLVHLLFLELGSLLWDLYSPLSLLPWFVLLVLTMSNTLNLCLDSTCLHIMQGLHGWVTSESF